MKRFLLSIVLLFGYANAMEQADTQATISIQHIKKNFVRLTNSMFAKERQRADIENYLPCLDDWIYVAHMAADREAAMSLLEVRGSCVDCREQLIREQRILLAEIAELKMIIDHWNETAGRPMKVVLKKMHDPEKNKKRREAQKREQKFKQLEGELTNKMIMALTINKSCSQLEQQLSSLNTTHELASGIEGAELILSRKSTLENLKNDFNQKKAAIVDDVNKVMSDLSCSKEEFIRYCGLITAKAQLKMDQKL